MSLHTEISRMSLAGKIVSDEFSVGELVSLYRDGEVVLPEGWQDRHTWSETQKSALIESLMLRIPVSSFYFAHDARGRLEIQDGVARAATILEFLGELPDGQGGVLPPLRLSGTDLLPSLEGLVWKSDNPDDNAMPPRLRFEFRMPKLTTHILERTASSEQRAYFRSMARFEEETAVTPSPAM